MNLLFWCGFGGGAVLASLNSVGFLVAFICFTFFVSYFYQLEKICFIIKTSIALCTVNQLTVFAAVCVSTSSF